MIRGTVILVEEKEALVLFEGQNIQKYKEMAKRLKERQCSESFQKRVQRLKEDNVKRSRELKEQHPLPPLLLSE